MHRIFTTIAILLFALPLAVNGQPQMDSLKNLLQQTTDDSVKIILLNNLSKLMYGYKKESVVYAQQALELAKKINSKRLQGDSYYRLAWHYYVMGEIDRATPFADSALLSFERSKYLIGVARCYNLQAIFLMDYGATQEAEDRYKKALWLYDSLKNTGGKISILNNLGVLLNENRKFEEALERHRESLELSLQENAQVAIGRAYYNLGLSHFGLKNYPVALENLVQSYWVRREAGFVSGLGESLVSIAEIAFGVEDPSLDTLVNTNIRALGFEDVYQMLDTAMQIAIEFESYGMLADVYKVKKKGYQAAGDYEKAFYCQKKYHELLDSNKLTGANLASFVNLKTRLENEVQKNHILALQNAKTREELVKQKRVRERNLLALLAAILLIAGLLGFLAFRQRLKSRNLEIQLKNKQLTELEQLHQITAMNAMLAGQESERERISKDLHDGLGNLLSTIKIHLNNIQKEVNELSDLNLYQATNNLVDEACTEVRKISHDMMPVSLQKLGLVNAVEELCRKQNIAYSTEFHFQYFGAIGRMESPREIMIYRICQELINNIIKHARAKEVIVELTGANGRLFLTVEDDGIGFDLDKTDKKKSLGLRSIESRVLYLNGTVSIDSQKRNGTSVNIEIPLG